MTCNGSNVYLIIGAGNFGAATALSLTQSEPLSHVILVDSAPFPNPRAASHDISKIVRDDYADTSYMRVLVEAMQHWRNTPLYSQFYHQTGVLRADTSDFSDQCFKAYKELGVDTPATWISVDEARSRWNGVFATADFEGLEKVMWNPHGGWAAAEKALTAVIQAAVDRGVEYRANGVEKLLFGGSGNCTGARLRDGSEIKANSTLVCAGASTAELLFRSDPSNKYLHAGDRAISTGAVSFYVTWDDATREKFKDVPVFKNCLPKTKGEGMSLTEDGTVKFNIDMCFTNDKKLCPGGPTMSITPNEPGHFTWAGESFPKAFKEKAADTMAGIYGESSRTAKIEGYRICWDTTTPRHDFLICPHPNSGNLYIATGGSFHGWKFLPVIGDYIMKMMKGTLDEDLSKRWAWDVDGPGPDHMANPTYKVVGNLDDFLDK